MTTGYPISFAADIASSVVNIEWPGGLGIFVVFKNFSNKSLSDAISIDLAEVPKIGDIDPFNG